jgi:hypothetical protein
MKKAVFWDVAPCRYCVNRRFGERNASIYKVEEKRRNSGSDEPAWAGANRTCVSVIHAYINQFERLKYKYKEIKT